MQTFLPLPDLEASVKTLDWRRLGKQRVEAMQLLKAMDRTSGGWVNHPATRMWREHRECLCHYMNLCILEWIDRGYNNNMPLIEVSSFEYPKWFGDEEFHASHRSNLLRKDPVWYGQFDWSEGPDLPYIWPD